MREHGNDRLEYLSAHLAVLKISWQGKVASLLLTHGDRAAAPRLRGSSD